MRPRQPRAPFVRGIIVVVLAYVLALQGFAEAFAPHGLYGRDDASICAADQQQRGPGESPAPHRASCCILSCWQTQAAPVPLQPTLLAVPVRAASKLGWSLAPLAFDARVRSAVSARGPPAIA